MVATIVKRLAWALVIIWATTTLAFVVTNALPSDPARMIAGPQARPQDVERLRRELGLNQSLRVQYVLFVSRLVHLPTAQAHDHANCGSLGLLHIDLGRSYQARRPVVTILWERFPRTLLLALVALFVQAGLGVTLGVVAAEGKGTWVDKLAVGGSLVGVSAPTFITGIFFQWVFAYRLRLLPLDGYGTTLAEHARCVILPALTLGLVGASFYTRIVRDEMIVQLRHDYVRTARAKGLSRWRCVVRHALRNAWVPVVTVLGLDFASLLGGAIVVEQIFRWPGLGSLSVAAMLDRDGPVIMGTVIVTSVAVVIATMLVDATYSLLDPRVRR